MVAKSASSRNLLAIAVSVIPALFEPDPPVGSYRRLLNSVLVVVRLCTIPVAVVVSPSRRLVSSPRRLVTWSPCRLALPPRRLIAAVPDRHLSHLPFVSYAYARNLKLTQL